MTLQVSDPEPKRLVARYREEHANNAMMKASTHDSKSTR